MNTNTDLAVLCDHVHLMNHEVIIICLIKCIIANNKFAVVGHKGKVSLTVVLVR